MASFHGDGGSCSGEGPEIKMGGYAKPQGWRTCRPMNMGGGEAAEGQLITVFVQRVCTLKLPGLLSGLLIAHHPFPIMLVLGALKQLPAV